MPTIIDSLLIELGLDSTKLKKGTKEAGESLKKFDEQQQKTTKNTEAGAKDVAEGFTKVGGALLALSAIYGGVRTFSQLVSETSKSNAALGRTSRLLGINNTELKAWESTVKAAGGSADDFSSVMQGLQSNIASFKLGVGGEGVMIELAKLGLQGEAMQTGSVNLLHVADALKKLSETRGIQAANVSAAALGIDSNMFLLLSQGSDVVEKKLAVYRQIAQATEADTAAAAKLEEQWARVDARIDSIKNKLGRSGVNFSYHLASYLGMLLGDNPGAPRGVRNNNRGNIEYGEFARSMGATGTDGRFAIFPTMEAGDKATAELIRRKIEKSGLDTIAKLFLGNGSSLGWLGGGADLKDAAGRIAQMSKMTGIGPNQHINPDQYAAIQQAMIAGEGNAMIGAGARAPLSASGKAGATVQTHIGEINVHTPATDGLGITKDMAKALEANALINSAIMGSH